MSKQNEENTVISQGVDALITRLKEQGVTSGKNEADKMIKQAQDKANKILEQARAQAKSMIDEAHVKITQEKRAGMDALELAARNMRIELRQVLIDRFKSEVKRLIHKELSSEKTVRQLILILTLNTAEQLNQFKDKEIEIELPATVLEFDDIRKNPQLLEKDPLKILVQGVTHQMLKQGVHFKVKSENQNETGIKVKIVDENVEFDISENAITELLLKHLQPRFRALLEGLLQ